MLRRSCCRSERRQPFRPTDAFHLEGLANLGDQAAVWFVFACLALLLVAVPLQAADQAILKVVLNEEEKGEYFVFLEPEEDVFLSVEDLQELGFKHTPQGIEIEGKAYVSLQSLAPGVRFRIDEKDSSLSITAAPQLLKKALIDLDYARPRNVFALKDNTAFLNYSLSYASESRRNVGSLNLPFEIGISVDGVLGYSSFSYAETETEKKFIRLLSNITKDDVQKNRRLVLGDFFASSGPLGSGGLFGGVSLSRDFSVTPYFSKYPSLSLSGVLQTPSEVQIYINDMLVKSERMSPGEFTFLNLPVPAGVGNATLVLKDAFGRERRFVTPFQVSTRLLKEGLDDYSYNVGYQRLALGKESSQYDNPAFVGFHRRGFSHFFTAGMRSEADRKMFNVGPTATFLLPKVGEFDTAVAVSSNHGEHGHGASLSYFYPGNRWNGGFSAKSLSRNYSSLSLASAQDKPRLQRAVSLGFNQKDFGSLLFTISKTNNYLSTDSHGVFVSYNRQLTKDISFHLNASRIKAEQVIAGIFAGIGLNFGEQRSGSLNYQLLDSKATKTIGIQQNPPLGSGLGYQMSVSQTEGADQNPVGTGFVQYRAPHGIYSAGYLASGGENSYNLSMAGGVAFVDRGVYFTRPIADSFALVKVSNLKGVRVYYSNQVVGVTDENGSILVPDMISYYDNNLSIDQRDIPVNYRIPEIQRYVSPPLRGGGVAKFELIKLQGFAGRLFFVKGGQKTPAEHAGLEITIGRSRVDAVVGNGGEFYLENISPGRFPARLFLQNQECSFDMTIPHSEQMMVDLGEVDCEMDR
jgi:outer membrane usher protein